MLDLLPLILAYVFFIADNLIRELLRLERRDIRKTGVFDKKSSLLVAVYPILVLLTPLITLIEMGGRVPQPVQWLGILTMLVGVTIHALAQVALGRFYTGTLYVSDKHQLVTQGPYKYVRNPGYLGVMLLSVGFGLAAGNWYGLIALLALFSAIYAYRIKTEEAMLLANFGDDYRKYAKITKRLIPFII